MIIKGSVLSTMKQSNLKIVNGSEAYLPSGSPTDVLLKFFNFDYIGNIWENCKFSYLYYFISMWIQNCLMILVGEIIFIFGFILV